MVMKRVIGWAMLLGVGLAAHTGCSGKVTSPVSGGETNWLAHCDADPDCKGGTVCLCGLCTRSCDGDATCDGESASVCARSGSDALAATCGAGGPGGGVAGLCLAACPADGCQGPTTCVDGACVPAPVRDAGSGSPDSGSGSPDSGSGSPDSGSGSRDAGRDAPPTDGGGTAECTSILLNGPEGQSTCPRVRCEPGSATCSHCRPPRDIGNTAVPCGDDPCNSSCYAVVGEGHALSVPDAGPHATQHESHAHRATCPVGTIPRWDYLTYRAVAEGDAQVVLRGRTTDLTDGGIAGAPAVLAAIGADGLPLECELSGPSPCPLELAPLLRGAVYGPVLDLDLELRASSTGVLPHLAWWEARYTCVTSPLATRCTAAGRSWADRTTGIPNGCDVCWCDRGTLSCAGVACEACSGDGGSCASGVCVHTGSCGSATGPAPYCQELVPCPSGGEPACGCDGTTYANACLAEQGGGGVAHPGSCGDGLGCWDGEVLDQGSERCLCRGGKLVYCERKDLQQ